MLSTPVILTVAGSDCSGGAGIQADIKTISALKGYAASVITAVTAQNTVGVQAVYPIPPDIVRMQTESVMDDLQPAAVKIGMVHNAAIVRAIAECLQRFRPRLCCLRSGHGVYQRTATDDGRYHSHNSGRAFPPLLPDNSQFE